MNTRIIGIDLAVTAEHKAMVLDPANNRFIGRPICFRARPDDLERLLRQARQGTTGEVQLIAIMEATGMAWYPVGVYLQRQNVSVYRVNGQKTKDLRRVMWKHTGSDRIDSRVLASLYQLSPEHLERWFPSSGDQLALQRACRAYVRWRELDVAEQNRLQAYDQWAWDGLHSLIPTLALTWMRQQWYNPWRVRAAGVATLTAAWQALAPEKNLDTTWISRWVERAEQMTQVYGCEAMVGYDDLQAIMTHSLQLRADYAQQQKHLLQDKIQPLYRQLYPDCPLTTIQGIGLVSAAIYRAFISN